MVCDLKDLSFYSNAGVAISKKSLDHLRRGAVAFTLLSFTSTVLLLLKSCYFFVAFNIRKYRHAEYSPPPNINKSQINQIVSQIFNPTSSRLLTSLAIGLLLAPLILNTYASQGQEVIDDV